MGAGAAGLFAASFIKHKNTMILEKNSSCGRKLLISGSGQCNYTHECSIDELLLKYGDKGRFLKPAIYAFSNIDCINHFRKLGVNSLIREDGKVFPETLKSNDILDVLINECSKNGVKIRCNAKVNSIVRDDSQNIYIIDLEDKQYFAKIVILTTGGKSYQHTGSSGDGYIYAKNLGHTIEEISPALTPIYVENYQFSDLSGISFQDINLKLWRNNKKIKEFSGDLLITHKNLSGPVIIDNSRYFKQGDEIRINFTKYKNLDDFKMFIENKMIELKNVQVKNMLKILGLPNRFIDKIIDILGLSNKVINCSEISKITKNKMIELFTDHKFIVEKLGDYNIAMVTKGGVCVKEINNKTMESKIIKNLYFAGEIIDIDGNTGGYNLQAAFSTAKMVAESINLIK